MRTYAQISSGSHTSGLFTELKDKLRSLDTHLTISSNHKDISYWEFYSQELRTYKSIAKSAFHIVDNSAPLTESAALHTAYALYKKRPIIALGRFLYNDDVDREIVSVIEPRIRRMMRANLLSLEFAELSYTLNRLRDSVDYKLDPDEENSILNKIRSHLYGIVESGITEVNAPFK